MSGISERNALPVLSMLGSVREEIFRSYSHPLFATASLCVYFQRNPRSSSNIYQVGKIPKLIQRNRDLA